MLISKVGQSVAADAYQAGKEAAGGAKAGLTSPKVAFVYSSVAYDTGKLLKGVAEELPSIPILGNTSFTGVITPAGYVSGDDGFVGVMALADDGMTVGDVGIITKVRDNRVLVEIDGVPAVKKYAEWAGISPDSVMGGDLLVYTINSPLGVKDRLGDLTAIRHPMNGNDDFSMNIGANLAEKTAIIRMEATADELILSASKVLEELKAKMGGEAAAFHLVHCGGRRACMGDRINEVAEAVKKVAGDVPFIMEFTFGEYGFEDDGNNTTGGLMLSYTGFAK